MKCFNEDLITFLTERRNNALNDLYENERYKERAAEQKDLRSELETIISPEAKAVLDKLIDALDSTANMERNRLLLLGMTMQTDLLKRFDANTPEYNTFAEEFI